MEVKGIGEKTLEQLRPYVTVEGEPPRRQHKTVSLYLAGDL